MLIVGGQKKLILLENLANKYCSNGIACRYDVTVTMVNKNVISFIRYIIPVKWSLLVNTSLK